MDILTYEPAQNRKKFYLEKVKNIQDSYSPACRVWIAYLELTNMQMDFCGFREWIDCVKAEGKLANTINSYRAMAIHRLMSIFSSENPNQPQLLFEYEKLLKSVTGYYIQKALVNPSLVLSEEEVKLFIQKAPDKTALIAEFLYSSAVRISEACNIRLKSISARDQDFRQMDIIGKGHNGRAKARKVPVTDALYRRMRKGFEGEVFLMETKNHTQYYRQDIYRYVKRDGRRILDRHLHPHMFRHSRATHLLRKGVSPRIVAELLGHESLATTLGMYDQTSLVLSQLKLDWR